MGIYIKGMELPTNEPLIVKINPDSSVSTTWKNDYKKYKAVSVPPHGDLIDRNAYLEEMNNHIQDEAYFAVANSMPTIIEAEGE